MDFPQRTIAQILDSEREMIYTASARYGEFYETARDSALLLT